LSLRKSQRLYGLIASVPTTLIGFFGGASYFVSSSFPSLVLAHERKLI
jgi:hypothetical protein